MKTIIVSALAFTSSTEALLVQPASLVAQQKIAHLMGRKNEKSKPRLSGFSHGLLASCSFPISTLASDQIVHNVPPHLIMADLVFVPVSLLALVTTLGIVASSAWGVYKASQLDHDLLKLIDETSENEAAEAFTGTPFSDHILNFATTAFAAEAATEAALSVKLASNLVDEMHQSTEPRSMVGDGEAVEPKKVSRKLLEEKLKNTQQTLAIAALVFNQMNDALGRHLEEVAIAVEQKASKTSLSKTDMDAAADALWAASLEHQVAALLVAASAANEQFPLDQAKYGEFAERTRAAATVKANEFLAAIAASDRQKLKRDTNIELQALAEKDAEAIEETEEADPRHQHRRWRPKHVPK
jgi:hypothetical protein